MKTFYMETIESKDKNLTTFAHSGKRGTNLSDTPARNLALKDLYKDFFEGLVDWKFPLHEGKTIKNFCGEWVKFNRKFKDKFHEGFRGHVDSDEQCSDCWKKFKGNCGEIFAEWFFRYGDCSLIEQDTYTTVDPDNENFTDASADSSEDGFPVGIQVKNWSSEVSFDVFKSACAQITQTAMSMKMKDPKFDMDAYMRPDSCRQVVFSMTPRVWNKAMDMGDWLRTGLIEFIGPTEIDKYMNAFTVAKFRKQMEDKIISKLSVKDEAPVQEG